MGYDAPRPFVPGFWVPACAGMTGINREWFTLTLALSHRGRGGLRERRVFSLAIGGRGVGLV